MCLFHALGRMRVLVVVPDLGLVLGVALVIGLVLGCGTVFVLLARGLVTGLVRVLRPRSCSRPGSCSWACC